MCECVWLCVYMCVCGCVCVCVYMCVCVVVCVCVCECVCKYIYMCVCVFVQVHMSVHKMETRFAYSMPVRLRSHFTHIPVTYTIKLHLQKGVSSSTCMYTVMSHQTVRVRSRVHSCTVSEQILLKPTLKCLTLSHNGLGEWSHNGLGEDSIVPHLTEALERQVQTVGNLQELNLSHNHLGYVTHDNLITLRLFTACV